MCPHSACLTKPWPWWDLGLSHLKYRLKNQPWVPSRKPRGSGVVAPEKLWGSWSGDTQSWPGDTQVRPWDTWIRSWDPGIRPWDPQIGVGIQPNGGPGPGEVPGMDGWTPRDPDKAKKPGPGPMLNP
ncbi:hypothetical protein BS47DRAFT_1367080 [Hydnum rufescens UP504]|uniref:Uncharacterized protein n=1 Tax=Hydnum rufescens UP504 TaxID=1448309 RepID=A0A9P6AJ49_9AGAM|nr:hypothetical protein BS47DRAFT_1367080 [Hydnum rufescens UP504]